MRNYNSELDELFEQWIASYPQEANATGRFCKDGLVLKNGGSNDINRAWAGAERRIMFLLKDCPDGSGYDVRELLTKDPNAEKVRELNTMYIITTTAHA